MKLRSLALASAVLVLALPALAIDIIDLHANTSTGVPTMLGTEVTIGGIVTVPELIYSDYSFEVYVQDGTAGINVYISGAIDAFEAALGDSVTVTGPVAQYNGLTELGTSEAVMTVINHGPGSGLPEPAVLTCADVLGTFQGDYSEPNESRLIRINDLTIVDGTWPTVPSGGNSYIDVTDGTGTLLLFIDVDCPVNGSPAPDGSFDCVGVLKQYDSSSPYTEGYQIQPRFIEDVVIDIPGPPIIGLATVRNVTDNSADVFFETTTPGSSEVEYGLTDAYGMSAGDAGAEVTEHEVNLVGLTDNSIYHYRVKTSDDTGTNYGPDQLLATASTVPGQMHVYMSYTADQTYSSGTDVPENQNFSALVVNHINQANVSVDACLYSFSLDNVRDALIDAHLRGCQVRIIIDDGNSSAWAAQCASYGIPYITSAFAGNHGADDGYGSMHNKWVTVDAFDDDGNKYNDWVWTGSGNMSISGNDDVNNGIRIRDYGLAQAYTFEFDEMWGVHGPGPHPNSDMGINKIDNTPHEFTINGIRVEQYMSPSDQVRYQIVQAVEGAETSIYFAILAFTDWQITNAMEDMSYAIPGLQIRGVFNQDQDCGAGSEYFPMVGDPCSDYAWANPADVWLDTALPSSRLLHHKYMIVDANQAGEDPLVLTGSHNFSYSAENYNDENTLIIHDYTVANMFLQEFADRYHESGGTGDLGTVVGVDETLPDLSGRLIGGLNSYPNPFNPFTNVSFLTSEMARVSVKIYDASGRLVSTLADDDLMEPGLHILGWDGKDNQGRRQPSGAYFARVTGGSLGSNLNGDEKAKLILLQ
ncbi:hypothetical protein H8E52_10380 [bacterium]|nr:hypothetical protein [bacterium]